jgi:hypothetical protein
MPISVDVCLGIDRTRLALPIGVRASQDNEEWFWLGRIAWDPLVLKEHTGDVHFGSVRMGRPGLRKVVCRI